MCMTHTNVCYVRWLNSQTWAVRMAKKNGASATPAIVLTRGWQISQKINHSSSLYFPSYFSQRIVDSTNCVNTREYWKPHTRNIEWCVALAIFLKHFRILRWVDKLRLLCNGKRIRKVRNSLLQVTDNCRLDERG